MCGYELGPIEFSLDKENSDDSTVVFRAKREARVAYRNTEADDARV